MAAHVTVTITDERTGETRNLVPRERAILLDLLIGERNRIRRSRAKDWRPSTRVMAIADLQQITDKLTGATDEEMAS